MTSPAARRVRKNKDEPSAVAWLWRQTRRRRRRLAVCVLPLLLSSVLVLLLGWGLRQAVDSGLAAAEPAALNLWTALLLLIVAMVAALAWARLFLTARLAEEIVRELRLRLLGGLLRADPRRFTSLRREGAVASALADSTLLQSGLITFFPMALRHLILLLGGLLLGLLTEPRLALVFLFFLSPVVLAVAFLGRRVRGYSRRAQSRLGEVAGLAEEAVAGIETVQAFGGEDEFARRFGAALDSAHVVSLLRVRWRAHLTSVAIGLSSGVAVLIFWLGARDVLAGGLSPGALSAFVFYAVVVAGAAGALGEVSGEVQRILGAAERLGELERMT
ncbi:MAG: ABC transporter transmembrane domain-containing protein, partial [Alphaproteobacteria bacterium]|nr:ABC transporter transmembrane domain-containing protein [Alphaproteobacteria bacterium]